MSPISGKPSYVSLLAACLSAVCSVLIAQQEIRLTDDERLWESRFTNYVETSPIFCRLKLTEDETKAMERVLIEMRASKDKPLGPVPDHLSYETQWTY
jgi:hypothetical protein